MKISLALFILGVVGIGWAIGYFNIPGEWYAQLVKPAFNPPNWVFGPMWTFLYILIAIAGWRMWKRPDARPALDIWVVQMVLNFVWSPVFFSLHRLDAALVIIVGLLASILTFIALNWRKDRMSAVLFIPYALWVGFAGVLNLSLWMLN